MDIADQAQKAEALNLAQALELRRRAALSLGGVPGVCSNCGEQCLPCAVYCDAECREDHEARVRRSSIEGRA